MLPVLNASALLPPDYDFSDKNYNKDEWKEAEKLLPPESFAGIKGDADRDGLVTAADARAVLRASAGLFVPGVHESIAADTDNDNKITAADARI